jgi:hypothetical protein
LWLCENIIVNSGYYDTGIPVGSLTSQLFANVYLNELDHYIKDKLAVKYYVRYMDDFVILGDSKKYLWSLLNNIEYFLADNLILSLNPKTSIFPSNHGIDFAGYRTWATHILPRKRNVKRFRRKFKKLMKLYNNGDIDLEYIKPRVMSFLGYVKHCNSYITTKEILKDFVLVRK